MPPSSPDSVSHLWYILQYILYIVHYIVYIMQYIAYIMQYIVCIVQCTVRYVFYSPNVQNLAPEALWIAYLDTTRLISMKSLNLMNVALNTS